MISLGVFSLCWSRLNSSDLLELAGYSLQQIWKDFGHYLFNYFSTPFSVSSKTPITCTLGWYCPKQPCFGFYDSRFLCLKVHWLLPQGLLFLFSWLSHLWLFSHGLQHTRLPCPPLSPGVCSNSRPLIQCCHPTSSSSVIPFSFCLPSFPASGCFPMSWLFASGGQSNGVSVSVLPMNIQDWFPLGWTGLISLLSKGLSRVFSDTTVQKHQFFGTQLSL